MKKVFIAIAAAVIATACNQAQIEQQQWQIDSLQLVNAQKDSSMALLATTMSDIQTNLNTIKEKEGIVSVAINGKESNRSQIDSDIDAIYNLLLDNKEKVTKLQAQLRKVQGQNAEYEKVIAVLQEQIDQQNKEIERLNAMLEEKNIEIGYLNNAVIRMGSSLDSLSTVSAKTAQELDAATEKLNTAYYVVASKSELKEKGIITSDGLFSKKVSADASSTLFTEVDITSFNELEIGSSKVKMLSSHPTSSFTLTEKGDNYLLTIKDTESFWSRSRYLVIQTK